MLLKGFVPALMLALMAMLELPICALAQDFRPEIRVVNHWQQKVATVADKSEVAVAGYLNEPDVLHGGVRVYGVAGFALRKSDKSRWVEVMGGGLASSNGFDAALDVRAQARFHRSLVVWGHYEHLFKSKRTLLATSITTPITRRISTGVESDTWLTQVDTRTGFGPKVGVALTKKVQLVSAYQFALKGGPDVWRTYLVINW